MVKTQRRLIQLAIILSIIMSSVLFLVFWRWGENVGRELAKII